MARLDNPYVPSVDEPLSGAPVFMGEFRQRLEISPCFRKPSKIVRDRTDRATGRGSERAPGLGARHEPPGQKPVQDVARRGRPGALESASGLGLDRAVGLLPGRCRRCRFLKLCNGNMRVRAEAATGDVWGEDPACYLTDQEIAPVAGEVGGQQSAWEAEIGAASGP